MKNWLGTENKFEGVVIYNNCSDKKTCKTPNTTAQNKWGQKYADRKNKGIKEKASDSDCSYGIKMNK